MSTRRMTLEKYKGTRFNKITSLAMFLFIVTVVMNHEIPIVRYMGTCSMFFLIIWMVWTFSNFVNETFEEIENN